MSMDELQIGAGTPKDLTAAPRKGSAEELLDTMVRDFCAVGPKPKSEVRWRILDYAASRSCEAREQAPLPDDDEKEILEALKQRDNAQEWGDRLAYKIGEYFKINVGEHSDCNDPRRVALDILNGGYKIPGESREQATVTPNCTKR